MEWLATWQGTVSVFIASVALVLVVLLITRRYSKIKAGNVEIGEDGEVLVKKASLMDDEIDRISKRLAERLDDHKCQYRDIIAAGAAMFEPLAENTIALDDWAIEQGKNGQIRTGRAKLAEKLAKFEATRDGRVIA